MKLSTEDVDRAKSFLQEALRACEAEGMIPVGVCLIDPELENEERDCLYFRSTGEVEAMGVARMLLQFAESQIALHGAWCPGTLPYAIDFAAYRGPKSPPFSGGQAPP